MPQMEIFKFPNCGEIAIPVDSPRHADHGEHKYVWEKLPRWREISSGSKVTLFVMDYIKPFHKEIFQIC